MPPPPPAATAAASQPPAHPAAAPQAAAAVPVRTVSTSAPSFAAETEYSNAVFYPEPEVEVGEAAPAFSLPGALPAAAASWAHLCCCVRRQPVQGDAAWCSAVDRR